MSVFNIPEAYNVGLLPTPGLAAVVVTGDPEWANFCAALLAVDHTQAQWNLAGHHFESFDFPVVVMLQSYYDFLNSVDFCPLNPDKRVFHIEGQSGTGKSTMIIVLAKHCMLLARPFIYSIEGQYFYWSTTQNGKIDDASDAFNDRGVTWFMDQSPCGPYFTAHCRVVLVTSPNDEYYGKFKKRFGRIMESVFMPLPTYAECQTVVANYIHVTDFQDRYDAYGPILRILCAVSRQGAEIDMMDALRASDYSAELIDNAIHTASKLKRFVFHQSAGPDFMPGRPTFGTKYLADCYMRFWRMSNLSSQQRFLSNPSSTNYVEHDLCFEMYSHDRISTCAQSEFFGRRLHGLNQSANTIGGATIKRSAVGKFAGFIPRTEVLLPNNTPVFANVNPPAGPNGCYLRPKYTNFGAVDAVVLNPLPGVAAFLFQMTTNLDHGINDAMLAALIARIDAMIPGGGTIRLFIVMPSAKAEILLRQGYLRTPGHTVFLTAAQLDRIEQYSLGINISPP